MNQLASSVIQTSNRPDTDHPACSRRLRLLSYNIQTGIPSKRYHHYLTKSWKHILPHAGRWHTMDHIAYGLGQFDIVALQEMDAGSLRTSFINQANYLAERANFPFWYHHTNRKIGNIARHSNGLLTKLKPSLITNYKLPGLPGRGMLMTRFGDRRESLTLFITHLALGKRARVRQIAFLSKLINLYPHAVLMGDLNCDYASAEMELLLRSTQLRLPPKKLRTFPSWKPKKHLDHILVTPDISVEKVYIPHWHFSDHMPIAMNIVVPDKALQ